MLRGPFPFTLRQLQYVVSLAETLSFRQAAERCRVSQPALSAQISELEEALGVLLFERDRRRVLVTPAGARLLTRATQLLVAAEDLLADAKQVGDPLAGSLRIGVIPTISPYLLPSITPPLREDFPRLTIMWVEEKTSTLVHSLENGGLDAALLALEADIGDVEREIIARDDFLLATPVDHPLGAKAAAASAKELSGASVLLLEDGHCFRDQALAFCTGAKARELEFRATSLSTLAQMVAGGAGVTLLPRLAVPTETRRAELKIRPLAAPTPDRTIGLVWRRGSPLGAALSQLAATMRRVYPGATTEKAAGGGRAAGRSAKR